MKIGIVGAGALGGYYGAQLARSGFDIHLLLRRDFSAVNTTGLAVKSPNGDFIVRAPCYERASDIGPCDLVIVGLKTTDNTHYQTLIAPLHKTDTAVLTLQNGMGNEEQLAAHFGAENILGGVAFLCANRLAPGIIEHLGYGQIELAEFSGAARERTQTFAAMFQSSGVRCEISDSLRLIRWRKSVWNIPFNGLSVTSAKGDHGATVTDVLGDRELHEEARALMIEVIASACAAGSIISNDFINELIARSQKMGAYKSSMQIDFENGRPLEIEAIIGEPARRARAIGIATPHLHQLYTRLSEIEAARGFK